MLVEMAASCSVMEVSLDVMAAMAVRRVVVDWEDVRERASLVLMTGAVSCKVVMWEEELLLELLYWC